MKCGIAPGTAREKLRVANALFDLPQTSTAFAKGDLSYSKARYLSCSSHRDGSVTLSVELPKETADLVMKALEMAVPQLANADV